MMLYKCRFKDLIFLIMVGFILNPAASFAGTVYYMYDDLNRLVYVLNYEDGSGTDYIYDEVGNREQEANSQLKDSDNDDIPDSFEIYYGLNPFDPDDAGYDNDDDDLTNLQEYQTGTDPFNPDTDGDGSIDSADSCPTYPPVRIAGAYFATLQDAYNAALGGENIESQSVEFTENLNLDKPVTFMGGYDCNYTGTTGKTRLKGQMLISNGKVTVKDFTLAK